MTRAAREWDAQQRSTGRPRMKETETDCDHGVTFDEKAAQGLNMRQVRLLWPRLCGDCPKGCGFSGIAYASMAHFIAGDW